MAYIKKEWDINDPILPNDLNNIENGIYELDQNKVELVNSMEGNETNKAPSVNAVKTVLTDKADKSELADKADKSELSGKANSSDVYTKTNIDEKLSNKATVKKGTNSIVLDNNVAWFVAAQVFTTEKAGLFGVCLGGFDILTAKSDYVTVGRSGTRYTFSSQLGTVYITAFRLM